MLQPINLSQEKPRGGKALHDNIMWKVAPWLMNENDKQMG